MDTHPPTSRPIHVKIAVMLLMTSCAIGIIKLATHGSFNYPQIVSLVTYAWGLLLAWVIFHGKNWARWLCLVLIAIAVLSLVFSPTEIRRLLARPAIEIVWFSFQSLLSPAAVALLFLPPSNEWFRQQRNAA